MHFDDRLATVLRHRASGERAARTQFRQLLDLLGSRVHGRDEGLLAAAWLRLGALGETIPAGERAEMVREPGTRFRNPELALHLAEDEPEVAAAALATAQLSVDDWEALIPRLPIRARGFLRMRRDLPPPVHVVLERLGIRDRGLPRPAQADDAALAAEGLATEGPVPRQLAHARPLPASEPANDRADPAADDSAIGALVKRIEAFRKARPAKPGVDDPPLPLGDQPRPILAGFAFTTNPDGRIDWADAAVAPMVVGTIVPAAARPGRRQPLRAVAFTLAGAPRIAGEWVIDAAPQFAQSGGRFVGYAGRFRRPPAPSLAPPSADGDPAADKVRQLLHELKTPVNAIQGFAEVIQQQLFGPTPHEYRALAATIAGDAARILAGFDELDRLARLESGTLALAAGSTDFAARIGTLAQQLDTVMHARGAAFRVAVPDGEPLVVALDTTDAEALAWRLLATVAGAVGAGENVPLSLSADARTIALECGVPAALATLDDPFATSVRGGGGALSAGMFGSGFSLRLARAEARAAGGNLVFTGSLIRLTLPRMTVADADHGPAAVTAQG